MLRPFILCLLLGLGSAAQGYTVPADDRGQSHSFERAPQSIVSLLPSLTETVCALGACSRLVGVDRGSNWPHSVSKLAVLGVEDDFNLQALIALRPDVVLASTSLRSIAQIEAEGIKVIALDLQNQAGLQRGILLIATLLANPGSGRALLKKMAGELAQVQASVSTEFKGKRVYFELASDSLAAGAASFLGETLRGLGLENIASHELGPFPKLNAEFVLREDPDIVMGNAAATQSVMPKRPGWSRLQAFTRGQVCAFSPKEYELLLRPGPRIAQGAQVIAKCLARFRFKPVETERIPSPLNRGP